MASATWALGICNFWYVPVEEEVSRYPTVSLPYGFLFATFFKTPQFRIPAV